MSPEKRKLWLSKFYRNNNFKLRVKNNQNIFMSNKYRKKHSSWWLYLNNNQDKNIEKKT